MNRIFVSSVCRLAAAGLLLALALEAGAQPSPPSGTQQPPVTSPFGRPQPPPGSPFAPSTPPPQQQAPAPLPDSPVIARIEGRPLTQRDYDLVGDPYFQRMRAMYGTAFTGDLKKVAEYNVLNECPARAAPHRGRAPEAHGHRAGDRRDPEPGSVLPDQRPVRSGEAGPVQDEPELELPSSTAARPRARGGREAGSIAARAVHAVPCQPESRVGEAERTGAVQVPGADDPRRFARSRVHRGGAARALRGES